MFSVVVPTKIRVPVIYYPTPQNAFSEIVKATEDLRITLEAVKRESSIARASGGTSSIRSSVSRRAIRRSGSPVRSSSKRPIRAARNPARVPVRRLPEIAPFRAPSRDTTAARRGLRDRFRACRGTWSSCGKTTRTRSLRRSPPRGIPPRKAACRTDARAIDLRRGRLYVSRNLGANHAALLPLRKVFE